MKKIAVLLVSLFVGLQVLHAQKQITGTVTSAEDGNSLPGVSVVVKENPTVGTATDINGAYSLTVPEDGKTLIFSFVGMTSQEVAISGQVINVALKVAGVDIDEVVVVAYGKQKKGDITGSVSAMSSEQINRTPIKTIDKALQGSVSGVFVTSSSGLPGSAAAIRIRGISSITAGNSPLYVIDGVPVISGNYSSFGWDNSGDNDVSALSTIPTTDIESITVLKDAASMAIYGARAANGVILITTKSGKSGKTTYNFDASYGISTFPNSKYRKLTLEEEIEVRREGAVNAGLDPIATYPDSLLTQGPANWKDLLYRQGKTSEYSFTSRGGNEKTSFFASVNYLNQEGIVIDSKTERIGGRINVDHKASEMVSFGIKSGVTRTLTDVIETWHLGWENPYAAYMWIPEHVHAYLPDGSYNLNIGQVGGFNPMARHDLNTKTSESYRTIGNVYLDLQFIQGLHLKTEGSADLYNILDKDAYVPPAAWDDLGSLYESKALVKKFTYKELLSYDKSFAKHNISALIGFEAEKEDYNFLNATGLTINPSAQYFIPGLTDYQVNSNDDEYGFTGLLSKLNYNFDNKYYLGLSFRRDGSSRFGSNNKYAYFGSVSASWRISKESFVSSYTWLDDLRLRASYGTSGNADIGNYTWQPTYSGSVYRGNSGLVQTQIENPDLTWEQNAQLDIGLELGLFKRFTATIDYYNRKTSDMLLEVPVSQTTGFSDVLMNNGDMVNKGFDFEFHTINLEGKLKWETTLNISLAHNEITALPKGNILKGNYSYMIGQDVTAMTLYSCAGVDPATGEELFWHINYANDSNGNPDYTKEVSRYLTNNPSEASRHIAGDASPKMFGGISNTLSFKGIELTFLFDWIQGRKLLVTANKYVNTDGRDETALTNIELRRWQKPGDVTDVPQYLHGNPLPFIWDSDRFLTSADFLRLKTLSLSYNFPQSLIKSLKIGSLRVYIQGSNIYTWHKANTFDPDRAGYLGFTYPNPRVITMGINLGF